MIKNFVYLDVEKLYSLSSQVFEGITEYILNESSKELESSESQKAEVFSGRVLGEILRQNNKILEKKFLHDFSYLQFEKKLLEDGLVSEVTIGNKTENIDTIINKKSFVKAKGKVTFNDMCSINNTLDNFNNIGKALANITTHQEQSDPKIPKEDIYKIAKKLNLLQDQKFLNDLSLVLKYGFQDQLEVQMLLNGLYFSGNLKRECLRENENLIIRKYSRHTEVDFVLFGIVTQYQRTRLEDVELKSDSKNLKESIMYLVSHLTNMESNFTGRLSNEIILDPIALYTEL